MTSRAVFFDRDGTLIRDAGYPRDPGEVEILPGVVEALIALRQAGFKLVVISNQSGIGRGLVTEEEAASVDRRFQELLRAHGVVLDGTYYCPHAPAANCTCRKPEPGLLHQAARDLEIDLSQSWMIGDKPSDVEAGRRAGCQTLLLEGTSGQQAWNEALRRVLNDREAQVP